MKYISHKFFCINCGKEGIPISRNIGYAHKSFHRKILYCPWCQKTINHIEITNSEDEIKFREQFANGEYQDEAMQPVVNSRDSWVWEKHLPEKSNKKKRRNKNIKG